MYSWTFLWSSLRKNKSLVVLMFDLHGPDLSQLRSEITYPPTSSKWQRWWFWWYVCTKYAVDTGTPVRHSFFLRYSRCQDQPLHAHENEEWYQKWLRRQRSQPSHTVEIGAGKCWHDPRIASLVFQLLLVGVSSMKCAGSCSRSYDADDSYSFCAWTPWFLLGWICWHQLMFGCLNLTNPRNETMCSGQFHLKSSGIPSWLAYPLYNWWLVQSIKQYPIYR